MKQLKMVGPKTLEKLVRASCRIHPYLQTKRPGFKFHLLQRCVIKHLNGDLLIGYLLKNPTVAISGFPNWSSEHLAWDPETKIHAMSSSSLKVFSFVTGNASSRKTQEWLDEDSEDEEECEGAAGGEDEEGEEEEDDDESSEED
eukprot:g35399.t1